MVILNFFWAKQDRKSEEYISDVVNMEEDVVPDGDDVIVDGLKKKDSNWNNIPCDKYERAVLPDEKYWISCEIEQHIFLEYLYLILGRPSGHGDLEKKIYKKIGGVT
ncbi:hypothetical protein RCL_jg28402.t1 [Rhizophagus clarus]|uniref:Uncharacterized protein n=1 Tax=Rhizophagus clarus TaxID=94130 RepID=A0A8H3M3W6_9GLOM|nr:hypothetical protein RCL_jg28402.t1 [Rhizophagus clarus]